MSGASQMEGYEYCLEECCLKFGMKEGAIAIATATATSTPAARP